MVGAGMFPDQCEALNDIGEQCAFTTHDGAHTFELSELAATSLPEDVITNLWNGNYTQPAPANGH